MSIVRFEDEFGNLTNNAPEDTLIELSHEHLRENLNWKLFVPETGFISLPNLYFNEAGIYTIQLVNSKTKEIFRSAPISVFPKIIIICSGGCFMENLNVLTQQKILKAAFAISAMTKPLIFMAFLLLKARKKLQMKCGK